MVFLNCLTVNQNIFESTVCFSKQANTKGREKKKIEISMCIPLVINLSPSACQNIVEKFFKWFS